MNIELDTIVSDIRNKIAEMTSAIDGLIETGYNGYEGSKDDKLLSTLYVSEVGKLILNKSILESVKICLDPSNDCFCCFTGLEPLLEKYYPNKKDWIALFGFLLAKAKRKYNSVVSESETEGLESLQPSFLENIVTDNGEFLPYIFTDEDRQRLQILGMQKEQISLIGKHCRSLFKKQQLEERKTPEVPIVRPLVVTDSVDPKERKEILNYLKRYLSLDTYDVVCGEMISLDTEENIVRALQKIGFSLESIEMIRHKIKKFNDQVVSSILYQKIENAKTELFSEAMHGKYRSAKETITDSNMVYTYIRNKLVELIGQIDNIIIDYVNGVESREDTIEYLAMAFEDLNYTLSLCGPVRKRTLLD